MPSTLAITMGDPNGVGPEVVVKALSRYKRQHRFVVIGDANVLGMTAEDLRSFLPESIVHLSARQSRGGVEFVRIAHQMAMDGAVGGVVTAPIRKQKPRKRNAAAPGHTELLSEWCDLDAPATMMMVSRRLKVSLATGHVPLDAVSRTLTTEGIFLAIERTHAALREQFGIADPKLAVMGLNPHAGESGRLGDEEKRIIRPAVQRARRRKWRVEGPLSADSAFHHLVEGRWDAAVAMYHDQGLIPAKLAGFGDCVNVTLGLPYVRTSVDHGTATDIAGEGVADPSSMVSAIRLAKKLIRKRAA